MVRKVKETLAETKARLTYELAQRTQNRISSLKVEAKAKAKRQQTGTTTGRNTTTPILYSTTTSTTTTTTNTTTTTTNEPTFQATPLK
jgi:hypothetical protein